MPRAPTSNGRQAVLWTVLGHAGIAALRAPVQRAMAKRSSGTLLVKTHSALTRIGGHPSHAVDVTGGAIYLVRDPRDVALSYADHLGVDVDRAIEIMATEHAHTDLAASHVTEFPGSRTQNVATWTAQGNDRVHVVRYEDLLAEPDTHFGAIVGFLGLEPEPAEFRQALDNTSFCRLSRPGKDIGFCRTLAPAAAFFPGRASGNLASGADRRAGGAYCRRSRRTDDTLRLRDGWR